MLPKFRR